MTKKLSAIDRQRVSNALTKCAAATKDIESAAELSEKAYQLLAKELGDNPGLFKAACQVYNSCKSIHKLSEADDSTRGNSFAILNVHELTDRLESDKANAIRKAASAPAIFIKSPTSVSEKPLEKAASAPAPKQSRANKLPSAEIAKADYATFLTSELRDAEQLLYKSAGMVRRAERIYQDAIDAFVSAMATEPSAMRKQAAARLYANYGERIVEAFDKLAEKRPLSKVASADYRCKYKGTPSLPTGVVGNTAVKLIEAADMLEARTKMHDVILEKTASMVLDHCRSYYGLGKTAAAGDGLAGLVVKSTALKQITDLFGDGDTDKDVAKDIFNSEFVNNMIAHSHRRAFMRAALNDALSVYPLHKLVPAYNRAVATLPANTRLMPATANQALIESLMAKELATGSVPSKADAELISTLANTIGKLRVKDGLVEGVMV